jgi:hypothetical protein
VVIVGLLLEQCNTNPSKANAVCADFMLHIIENPSLVPLLYNLQFLACVEKVTTYTMQ